MSRRAVAGAEKAASSAKDAADEVVKNSESTQLPALPNCFTPDVSELFSPSYTKALADA